MRRLLTVAGATLASVVLLVGGAVTPASAAGRNSVSVKGSVYIVDDEPLWRDNEEGTHELKLKSLHLPTNDLLRWEPCEGGEVVADLEVSAKAIPGKPGWVRVHAGYMLREGVSCHAVDIDDWKRFEYDMAPGETLEKTVKVETDENRSHDRATFTVTFTNWYVRLPEVPVVPLP